MKKIGLVVVAVVVSVLSFAQRGQFGLKAGVNIANFKDEVLPTVGSRTGYHVGGLMHIHLNPNWAVQPELMYSSQGAEYSGGKNKLDYITLPVLAQYMFPAGFRLQTGPQFGIVTSAVAKRSNGETSFRQYLKDFDVSWAFGAGYLTPSGLGVDARYNLGLLNIRKGGGADLKNRVWQFGAFYQFKH